jgi:conjugal transfer ATP-binding protein TraC
MLTALKNLFAGKTEDATIIDLKELTARDRFSSYLPWVSYDEDTKTYHNSDDTVGFIWECVPLAFAGDKTSFILEGLFRTGLPFGSVLQFIRTARTTSANIASYLDTKTRLAHRPQPPSSSPIS